METLNEGKAGVRLLTLAGALLALLWVASMSVVDGNACSAVPACLGLALVSLMAVAAVVAGQRPARPTLPCLLAVAAGLFFLLRCMASESVVESWRELPLVLGGFVFYGAGFLFVRRRGSGTLALLLAVAVLANVLYFFLLRETDMAQEWTGRPTISLTGMNSRGCTLFVYKNFAGIFLMLAGAVLLCRPLWSGRWSPGAVLGALAGLGGMACACFCGTRATLLLLPLLAVSTCVLGLVIRLHSGGRMGWGWPLATGLVALAVLVGVADLFLGHTLIDRIASIDTHLRTQIWRDICRVLPGAPWYGYGVGASQWMIVPFFNSWEAPNFAHNEYLQAWCDYGVAGLALMALVIAAHLSAGFWKLASEDMPADRRVLMAMAMSLLALMACCAVVDFVWHSFALVGLTAFSCGLLAAPEARRDEPFWRRRNWAKGSRPPLRPVRVMGKPGCALACMAAIALAAACAWHGWRLLPAWEAQWAYNDACHRGTPASELRRMLERALPGYPDTAIVDHYVMLPRGNEAWDWVKLEGLLRIALQSNPRQLFMVTMLVDALDRQGRHAEAEALLREKYLPGGQPGTCLTYWPAHYTVHLLKWAKTLMAQGDAGSALSMLNYVFNMERHRCSILPITLWRSGPKTWTEPHRNPKLRSLVDSCRLDRRAMKAVGIEPDDRWQQPQRPGGPPALYARWGKSAPK